MRILVLSTVVPFPPDDGGRMRVHELLRGLAAEGHDVELLTLTGRPEEDRDGIAALADEGVAVEAVPHRGTPRLAMVPSLLRGRSVHGSVTRSRALSDRLHERLDRGAVDLVQCEFSSMAGYRPDGRVPWVLDAHNVEFRISARLAATATGTLAPAYRVYARRESRRRRGEEVALWRQMDHVVSVSEYDRRTISDLAPEVDVSVVPNCIDASRFAPSDRPHEERTGAVFIGKLDYRPNVEGLLWFADAVLPLVRSVVPGFELTIVGRDPVTRLTALGRRPGIRVIGRVRDTVPWLHGSAVTVVPLHAGSGSRLKVLEAMATTTPVVSTSVGVEGLDVEPGRHVVVADGPVELADALVDLLADPSRRARLADAGRTLVEERYGWPQAVRTLSEVHEHVVAAHRARRG